MVVRGRTRNAIGLQRRVGSTPTISGTGNHICLLDFLFKEFNGHFSLPHRNQGKKNAGTCCTGRREGKENLYQFCRQLSCWAKSGG